MNNILTKFSLPPLAEVHCNWKVNGHRLKKKKNKVDDIKSLKVSQNLKTRLKMLKAILGKKSCTLCRPCFLRQKTITTNVNINYIYLFKMFILTKNVFKWLKTCLYTSLNRDLIKHFCQGKLVKNFNLVFWVNFY